ncbi:P-loop containing nucleoside triphosphate hydrolase protein [Pavlovales sp. CCMP2436]|nr:P-loop containing nucleoside triphosphate hydrolase protein [Pavlovales sp. CCMP2436]
MAALHWLCEPNKIPRRVDDTPPAQATFQAMAFPFPLDVFQRKALAALEAHESVLVAAHTSAGKTVVALYAVALSLARKQRVVYTSPIKALSNQKYRELREEFGDNVGLMTGDVTICPTADILVMTTEILRNMLYRGSEVVREVAWVVFDEVHYMRDKSRGVVWEETIVLLPHNARYIFLSATIPNATEFASWVAHVHNQPCHVVSTTARPTPLFHYIHLPDSNELHTISAPGRPFDHEALAQAFDGAKKKGGRGGSGVPAMAKIVKALGSTGRLPAIVFSFARKRCEQMAAAAVSAFNEVVLAGGEDAEAAKARENAVHEIFSSAIAQLSDEDQQLPAVVRMLPLLLRGVGLHHSGLLPILKEVVELLFQEGHIKVCATCRDCPPPFPPPVDFFY